MTTKKNTFRTQLGLRNLSAKFQLKASIYIATASQNTNTVQVAFHSVSKCRQNPGSWSTSVTLEVLYLHMKSIQLHACIPVCSYSWFHETDVSADYSYSRMRTHCIPKEAPNNEHIQQHAEAYAHSLCKLPPWSSIYWWSFHFTIQIRTLIILLSFYFWILSILTVIIHSW